MSWHAPCLPKWEKKNFSKKSVVVGQEILISERGCIMGLVNFLTWVQRIFEEYRKLHNCSIINNQKL